MKRYVGSSWNSTSKGTLVKANAFFIRLQGLCVPCGTARLAWFQIPHVTSIMLARGREASKM